MAGVNYAVSSKVQLIGAFTPVFAGDRRVWSVGVGYFDLRLGTALTSSHSNFI